jgi:hypothetical protein
MVTKYNEIDSLDLRDRINEATAGNITTSKVGEQRELVLKIISRELEILQSRILILQRKQEAQPHLSSKQYKNKA